MRLRVMLACTLLLLAAVPTFALPLCAECNASNLCENVPGAIERCYDWTGSCYTTFERCSPPRSETVLTEWKVASIEISRPSLDSIAVDAIAVTDPAPEAEVLEPEPAKQK